MVLGIDNINLSDVIGNSYFKKIFKLSNSELVIIPLPHPSGLSSWIYKDKNHELLKKGLILIQNQLK